MSLAAGATLLGAVGHLANLGQFVEIGQGHAYQKEQMAWARRAYCLDSRALRIDLLNAVKEDVRDHHQTYAGRIDTLLLVHTLLLTFALATLQYSDQFVPSSECLDCEENLHPWLVIAWVYSVSAILILPFWSMVMLIWSKLQLDRWLETSLGRLNIELRGSLATMPNGVCAGASADGTCDGTPGGASGNMLGAGSQWERTGEDLLERVEAAVNRLSTFVVEHQESFKKVWSKECRLMIQAATVFLWVSCVLAIGITAGMFWLFLRNHMEGALRPAASHFAACTSLGLLVPAVYALIVGGFCCSVPKDAISSDDFEDCIEAPPHLDEFREAMEAELAESEAAASSSVGAGLLSQLVGSAVGGSQSVPSPLLGGISHAASAPDLTTGSSSSSSVGGRAADGEGKLRIVGRRILQVVRLPLAIAGAARQPDDDNDLSSSLTLAADGGGGRSGGWARMDDSGVCMTERPLHHAGPCDDKRVPLAQSDVCAPRGPWMEVDLEGR